MDTAVSLIEGLPSDDLIYLARACVAAMAFHNIVKDELVEEVSEVTSISTFLEKVEGASTMLYV